MKKPVHITFLKRCRAIPVVMGPRSDSQRIEPDIQSIFFNDCITQKKRIKFFNFKALYPLQSAIAPVTTRAKAATDSKTNLCLSGIRVAPCCSFNVLTHSLFNSFPSFTF